MVLYLTGPSLSACQVIIEGFKSYRDQTSTEPFSPGINVVGEQGCAARWRHDGMRRQCSAVCLQLVLCGGAGACDTFRA